MIMMPEADDPEVRTSVPVRSGTASLSTGRVGRTTTAWSRRVAAR